MKVLFYQFFPGGGIGRYTDELATALSLEPGVEVEVACSPDFQHRDSASYPVWPRLFAVGHRISWVRRLRFLLAQWINPFRCLWRAKQSRADVIHFSNINHLSYAFWRIAARFGQFKIVATAHDVRRTKAILNRAWEEFWLAQFYRDADALFVHSSLQRSDLIDFSQPDASLVHIVPHGTYVYPAARTDSKTLKKNLKIPNNRRVGLCFGMVRDDKNVPELFRALGLQEDRRPFLIVAGKMTECGSSSRESLQGLVERLNLGDDVLLLDSFIETEKVGEFYQVADFACLTYRTDFTSQSGVLNVAMHFACPVLVTPAPTLAETVAQYEIGTVCDDDTAEAICLGMTKLIDALDGEALFDFEAYRRAHSWKENARLTVSVYRRILAEVS